MKTSYTIRHFGTGGLLDTETREDEDGFLTIAELLRNAIGRTTAADGDRIEISVEPVDDDEPAQDTGA